MIIAIILLAMLDVVLLAAIRLIYRNGVQFRSMELRFVAWLSAAVTFIGLLFSLAAPNILLSALVSVAGGCLAFLLGCLGAWSGDKGLHFVERQRAEQPELREAMEKNPILRTIGRFDRRQTRKK
jgi:hypothetical protein